MSNSHQVLARKWRPRSFATLVGQEHVVRALTHALEKNRLHHAYLFTGTRGVGKTTIARILAKSLNCEEGVSATPCGVCRACREIDSGRFVDLLEVDAATNTRVDEMRQLLENAVYAPTSGRYKVYVIDEVHMLSNAAFNAMLKTLEEPPPHVKFILATTDPQKIPVTVLSRCLQFNLKQMPVPQIIAHLQSVLTQEDIHFEMPALHLLAGAAQGSMRDALSLTDQAIAYSAGSITAQTVEAMLGTVEHRYLVDILQAVVAQNGNALLTIAEDVATRSLSFKQVLAGLASVLHRLTVLQLVPDVLDGAAAEMTAYDQALLDLAKQINPETVQLYYQIVLHGRNELFLAPDEATGFSMTLLRLLAFAPTHSTDGRVLATTKTTEHAVVSHAVGNHGAIQVKKPDAAASTIDSRVLTAPVMTEKQQPEKQQHQENGRFIASSIGAIEKSANVDDVPPWLVNEPMRELEHASIKTNESVLQVEKQETNALSGAKPAAEQSRSGSGQSPMDAVRAALGKKNNSKSSPLVEKKLFGDTAAAVEEVASNDRPLEMSLSKQKSPLVSSIFVNRLNIAETLPSTQEAVSDEAVSQKQHHEQKTFANVDDQKSSSLLMNSDLPDWPQLVGELSISGIALQLVQQAELLAIAGDTWRLRTPLKALVKPELVEKIAVALSELLGKKIQVSFEFGAIIGETFALRQARLQEERFLAAQTAIMQDTLVQSLMRDFDAQVVPDSIRPNTGV